MRCKIRRNKSLKGGILIQIGGKTVQQNNKKINTKFQPSEYKKNL